MDLVYFQLYFFLLVLALGSGLVSLISIMGLATELIRTARKSIRERKPAAEVAQFSE